MTPVSTSASPPVAKSLNEKQKGGALRTVLLIDDDVELLRQMAAAFRSNGYDVRAASDGLVGLEAFTACAPDLVVSDLIMPTREGIETIFAMKKARPDIPVIAVSGGYRTGPEDFLTLARHVGADDVLAKPFRLAELVGRAQALLAPEAPNVAAA